MYFWVLGKTPELSLVELERVNPVDLTIKWGIAFFETENPDLLQSLWGLIKWWIIVNHDELDPYVKECKIVGVDSQELWLMMKRKFGIRRYKELELRKSDLEIKRKWIEIRLMWKGQYGVVLGRQNIDLYSGIDFDKPTHGMQIGMMPSKLAHILVNIWLWLQDKEIQTVYDPFCGFGTTNFIANALGHHTIGSDINITSSKQNLPRRKKQEFFQEEKFMTFFKHDVNDSFQKPFLDSVDVIVSEWRLGPVIKSDMHKHKTQTETILKEYLPSIVDLYSIFLDHTKEKMPKVPIIMTIPEYLRLDLPIIANRIKEHAETLWYEVTYLGEVYQRKKQQVGRRVVVFR